MLTPLRTMWKFTVTPQSLSAGAVCESCSRGSTPCGDDRSSAKQSDDRSTNNPDHVADSVEATMEPFEIINGVDSGVS